MVRVYAEVESMFGTLLRGLGCGTQVLVSEGPSDPNEGSWEYLIRGYAVRLKGSEGSDRT